MARPSGTTSLQRTYRYLRLAIAGAVVVVFTAVLVAMPTVGLLPSPSHYYYTPANTMFVGALMAVSVCFFALSGRGAERVLLDAAATIVPLIAIVPTMISPRSVPGVDADCPRGEGSCVPQTFDAAVDAGIATYLVVGAVFVRLPRDRDRPRRRERGLEPAEPREARRDRRAEPRGRSARRDSARPEARRGGTPSKVKRR